MENNQDKNGLTKIKELYKKSGYFDRYGTDVFLTTVIIIGLLIINMYFSAKNILGPQNVKWDLNKCNPVVIPFAGLINKPNDDTVSEFTQKNFIRCTQSILQNIVDPWLKSLFLKLNNNSVIFDQLTESIKMLYNKITKIQSVAAVSIEELYKRLLLLVEPFRDFFTSIKDLFNRIKGIIFVIIYSLYSRLYTLIDAFDLLKKRLIQINEKTSASAVSTISMFLSILVSNLNNETQVCFDPKTKIMLKNGNIVQMKNIELGSTLKNGSVVESVMRISNLDNNNNIIQIMYKIEKGENNEPIYVTGSHLVYDSTIGNFVKVQNYRGVNPALQTEKECPELACLITSDHTIPIGSEIFHDWEDNNGSTSKTI